MNIVPHFNICLFISVLLRGFAGELRPQDSLIVATFGADGFTRFDLPANTFTFVLVPFQVDSVRITGFQLRASEICSNGQPLSVRVEYYTTQQVVSFQ